MRERRKSYRERYFENYEAVKVPAANRKGYRIEYRYTGQWAKWEKEGRGLKRVKQACLILEVIGVTVYVLAVLSGAGMTRARLFSGFGVLSLVPWIMELYGVLCFACSREFVREYRAEEIGMALRTGAVLHIILAGLSLVAGLIRALTGGTAGLMDIPAALGVIANIASSVLVKRLFDSLIQLKYRNDRGFPGDRV